MVFVFCDMGAVVVRKWPVAPVSKIRGLVRFREVRVEHGGFALCVVTLL